MKIKHWAGWSFIYDADSDADKEKIEAIGGQYDPVSKTWRIREAARGHAEAIVYGIEPKSEPVPQPEPYYRWSVDEHRRNVERGNELAYEELAAIQRQDYETRMRLYGSANIRVILEGCVPTPTPAQAASARKRVDEKIAATTIMNPDVIDEWDDE